MKGNVTIKGNVQVTSGSGGGANATKMRANKGKKFCANCFLKKMGIKL